MERAQDSVTNRGELVLPEAAARAIGSSECAESVSARVEAGELQISRTPDGLRSVQERLREQFGPDHSIVDGFIAEERPEATRDDARRRERDGRDRGRGGSVIGRPVLPGACT
jgi:hypothetical protein